MPNHPPLVTQVPNLPDSYGKQIGRQRRGDKDDYQSIDGITQKKNTQSNQLTRSTYSGFISFVRLFHVFVNKPKLPKQTPLVRDSRTSGFCLRWNVNPDTDVMENRQFVDETIISTAIFCLIAIGMGFR